MVNPTPIDARLELAKWVALTAMIAEHTGRFVLHDLLWPLFYVGRMAAPLFTWIIAVRLSGHPALAGTYVRRLAAWSLITQPVFFFAFQRPWYKLSFLPTLLFGVLLTAAFRRFLSARPLVSGALLLLACLALIRIPSGPIDGGPIAIVLTPALAAFAMRSPSLAAVLCGPAFLILRLRPPAEGNGAVEVLTSPVGLSLAVASLVALTSIKAPTSIPRLPTWVFYAFYPAHLLVLALIGRSIGVEPW